jgi:hypothetical protein
VPTIENFLPFHAVCSQGHLEILKLLLEYDLASNNSPEIQDLKSHIKAYFDESPFEYKQIYTGTNSDSKYFCSFDLNAVDMNGHTGLYAAVVANNYEICEYLLTLKFKKLSKRQIDKYERKIEKKSYVNQLKLNKKTISKSRTTSTISSSNKSAASDENSSGNSLFDHFKNVFLDIKSYDPYIVSYASFLQDDEQKKEQEIKQTTIESNNNDEDDASLFSNDNEQKNESADLVNENDEQDMELFNPIELNSYSKFGSTCN